MLAEHTWLGPTLHPPWRVAGFGHPHVPGQERQGLQAVRGWAGRGHLSRDPEVSLGRQYSGHTCVPRAGGHCAAWLGQNRQEPPCDLWMGMGAGAQAGTSAACGQKRMVPALQGSVCGRPSHLDQHGHLVKQR